MVVQDYLLNSLYLCDDVRLALFVDFSGIRTVEWGERLHADL